MKRLIVEGLVLLIVVLLARDLTEAQEVAAPIQATGACPSRAQLTLVPGTQCYLIESSDPALRPARTIYLYDGAAWRPYITFAANSPNVSLAADLVLPLTVAPPTGPGFGGLTLRVRRSATLVGTCALWAVGITGTKETLIKDGIPGNC